MATQDSTPKTSAADFLVALRPAQDLAKTFDIDISSCLEEYLEDIIDILPTQERQQVASELNFAKAAIVLHNSCFVYGKKVEYLHSLVYKTLDDIASQTAKQKERRARGKKVDEAVEAFHDLREGDDLLILDDIPLLEKSTKARSRPLQPNRFSHSRLSSTRLNASANQSLMMDNGGSDKITFNLLNPACEYDANGMLCLPRVPRYDDDEEETAPATNMESFVPPPVGDEHANDIPVANQAHEDDDVGFGAGGFGGDDDDDDHDNEGPGFAMASERSENEVPVAAVTNKRVKFQAVEKDDPWKLLDPHKPDGKPRPLRKGKTIKLPPTIDTLPSECVTGSSTRRLPTVQRVQRLESSAVPSMAVQTFQASMARKKRSLDASLSMEADPTIPKVPLKGLAFGSEFAYIAKAMAKRRAAERRAARKFATTNPAAEFDDDDDDEGGGFAFGGDYEDDDHDDHGAFAEDNYGNTGLASVEDAFPFHTDEGVDAPTFEDLCRAHVQKLIKGAEKYAYETKLSQRVGEWHDRLRPILEAEEERQVFDIHEYSNSVLEAVQVEKQKAKGSAEESKVDFGRITRHSEPHEVCRMFLATLSLVNSGNVRVSQDGRDCQSTLLIELLQTHINRPMETYVAPSTDMEGVVNC